jgi:hypothetical protein
MATTKVGRAGVGFGLGRRGGSIVLEVYLHHDIIPTLRANCLCGDVEQPAAAQRLI